MILSRNFHHSVLNSYHLLCEMRKSDSFRPVGRHEFHICQKFYLHTVHGMALKLDFTKMQFEVFERVTL